MTNQTPIQLISQSVSLPIIQEAFASLTPQKVRKANSILTTLHNRHTGITPQLAAELASSLLEPYSSSRRSPLWEAVIDRLQGEISNSKHSVGIILNALPFYTLIRLVFPIIREACSRISRSCLFCQDEIEDTLTIAQYNSYADELHTQIKKIAQAPDPSFKSFWQDRAITLASFSRRVFMWETIPPGTPETDLTAFRLVMELHPHVTQAKSITLPNRPMLQPLKHQIMSKSQEGGYSGIHVTRRQEYLGDILLSEFINPPLVLAERLTNDGFLALNRQPKRENLRDVFLAALMPAHIQPSLSHHFIKTLWLDFLSRISILLIQAKRMRSEFRWIEGDTFLRARSCRFLLQNLPPSLIELPQKHTSYPLYRKEFLTAIGWLPTYLDSRSSFSPIPILHNPTPFETQNHLPSQTQIPLQWAYSAWRIQEENPMWNPQNQASSQSTPTPNLQQIRNIPLDQTRYSTLHLMLFLPAEIRSHLHPSGAARLGTITSGFNLGNTSRRSITITWVPQKIDNLSQWHIDSHRVPDAQLFPPGKTKPNPQHIAGKIIETWRDILIKELRNA